jgi:protein required for attachment to host cells
MKKWLVLFLVVSSAAFAKDKPWQDASVAMQQGSIPERGFYWIRGAQHTYLIHNYANGTVVQWWVRLTLGDTVRIVSDGKNLRVIDNQNRERKCQILQEVTNASFDARLAQEARKSDAQRLAEKTEADAVALQQEAMRRQALQEANRQLSEGLRKDTTVKPLPTPTGTTINCTSNKIGDTTTTECH